MNAARRTGRQRFELFGDSLSGRVLWLIVAVILGIELIVLLPGLGRLRSDWMVERVTHAQLLAYAMLEKGGPDDPQVRENMMKFAGVSSIRLDVPGAPEWRLDSANQPGPAQMTIELEDDSIGHSTWHALRRIAGLGAPVVEIHAVSSIAPGAEVVVVADARQLTAQLRYTAAHVFTLTVIVALVTGLLVFAVLDRLLVRPMRVITNSIINFREDPEQDEASDLAWLAARPEDDISTAARELKIMQDEMRAALWRNARLAAVGTAVAKISHDLRNILCATSSPPLCWWRTGCRASTTRPCSAPRAPSSRPWSAPPSW
jgi:hypothetical protein